ncbi:hypothetical protein C8R44DRAFT_747631 [Mycena epipterygia]|nr:hypothetical protein C8R44DRAFT_747631 [Mycena epipterygia]
MSAPSISLKVEFSGGLELLFSNQRSHKLSVPATVPAVYGDRAAKPKPAELEARAPPADIASKPADITFLIHHLRDTLLKERVELFMEGGTVRPGILVLVNDTDWELEGEGAYVLQEGDEIVFISTLHGG